jgi:hypothetical protein
MLSFLFDNQYIYDIAYAIHLMRIKLHEHI